MRDQWGRRKSGVNTDGAAAEPGWTGGTRVLSPAESAMVSHPTASN